MFFINPKYFIFYSLVFVLSFIIFIYIYSIVQEAWETELNDTPDSANQNACLLAKYCDAIMKVASSSSKASAVALSGSHLGDSEFHNFTKDSEIKIQLNRVLSLFKHLQAKDFFGVKTIRI